MLALFLAVATFTPPPTLGTAQSRRDVILGAFAAGTAFAPAAAFAGQREDGIALLRKQAAAPKQPRSMKLNNGPMVGSGAVSHLASSRLSLASLTLERFSPLQDKCNVNKPCTTGAGIKWDPDALGVKKGATKPDGTNPTRFIKTPTYANSPY